MLLYYNTVLSFLVKYMALLHWRILYEKTIVLLTQKMSWKASLDKNLIAKMRLSAAAQVSLSQLRNRLFGLQYSWQSEQEQRLFKLHNCNVISGFLGVCPELPK